MRADEIGKWFRFITPVLITISIFILGLIVSDLKEVKLHFTNHLSEHKALEVCLEKRLTAIETFLQLHARK